MGTVRTKKEKDKAERKVNRAIDAMIDLQDCGWGCDTVSRIVELLNSLRDKVSRA